jgi:hypothetical protein
MPMRFRDRIAESRHIEAMAAKSPSPWTSENEVRVSPELEVEIVEAMAEIDRGDCIELTQEQLDHSIATGELPWPDEESLG